jgi:hypothetical protein
MQSESQNGLWTSQIFWDERHASPPTINMQPGAAGPALHTPFLRASARDVLIGVRGVDFGRSTYIENINAIDVDEIQRIFANHFPTSVQVLCAFKRYSLPDVQHHRRPGLGLSFIEPSLGA